MIAYKNTQTGYWIILPLVVAVVIFFAYVPLERFTMGHYGFLLACIVIGVLFYSLTVEVNHGLIKCYFGQGLIGKTFRVADLTSCEVVKVPWYWGWGIRWTPLGWMYNVSPTRGVRLKFASGKYFIIGSNEAEELRAVIEDEMKKVKRG